jgi:predicted phage terminase large subunit-like protein
MDPIDSSILIALLRNDFRAFVEKCFNHLNPGQPYHDNWHVGVIAHALAECLAGNTKRLIILLPPRNLKSTIVSIAWPAYVLGHFPSKKFVCASYAQELANQLSNDTRSIMNSDWYRELFPATLISPVKDTQGLFVTTEFGGRMATFIGGILTGFGGDIVIFDDPHKPQDMEHEGARHKARNWLLNTALSRFNSPKDGILIIVMQRLHEDDLAGYLIENNPEFTILKIPSRADEQLVYKLDSDTELHLEAGAYLQEHRIGPVEFEAKRKEMGSREFSAQYQLDPLPPDGGTFDFDWFDLCDEVPAFSELIMSVDVAVSEGRGNYTAVTLWGHLDHHWYLTACHHFQFDAAKVRLEVQNLDQKYQPDLIVIDSTGVGKGMVAELRNKGFKHIYPSIARFSKIQLANDVLAMIEGGRVSIFAPAPGLAEFRKQVTSFPHGKFDDFVDSMTQVLRFERGVVREARLNKRSGRRSIDSQKAHATVISLTKGGRIIHYC